MLKVSQAEVGRLLPLFGRSVPPMKLLPDPERIRKASASAGDQGLGQGAEIAIGLLVFFGLGAGLDWWAGTTP